jgi:putative SOS response-associated peptidase YedK
MCGRYALHSHPSVVALQFGLAQGPDFAPRYNIAPGADVLIVRETPGGRVADTVRWGLIPAWARDPEIGRRLNNARLETAHEKPSFRAAMRRRRCIIPADGFYEWTAAPEAKKKQPYFIHRPDGEPYAFAGVWERWKGPNGGAQEGTEAEPLRSCSIVTTSANEPMAQLHDRMPVMLPRSAWDTWLDPDQHDTDLLGQLLVPAAPELITFHAVSTEVNNARNKGEHLLDAVDPATGEPIGTSG